MGAFWPARSNYHILKEKQTRRALDLPCSLSPPPPSPVPSLFVVQVEDIVGHILSHLTTIFFCFHFISFYFIFFWGGGKAIS